MKFFALFFLLFFTYLSFGAARVRPKMTARLLGSAGAGVGSALAPDALFLNPASITFFEKSHFYFNQTKSSWEDQSVSMERKEHSTQDFVITDGTTATRGGIAFSQQNEIGVKRKSYSIAMGQSAGKNAALGFLLKRHEEKAGSQYSVFNQLTFGYSHVLNEKMTLGLVIQDLSRGTQGETRSILGWQYQVSSNLSFMLDGGSYYLADFFADTFYNTAIQFRLVDELFFRVGYFENSVLDIRGHGWGASWYGPKLSIEAGLRSSEATSDNYFLKGEKFKEFAVALDIRY